MTNSTQSTIVKKKQQRNLIIVTIILGLILIGAAYLMDGNKTSEKMTKEKVDTVNFASPLNHTDAQSVWVERAQNQLAQQIKTNSALEQQMQLLQQAKENQDKQAQLYNQTIQTLQTKVDALSQQLSQKQPASTQNKDDFPSPAPTRDNVGNRESFISDVTLNLTPLDSSSPARKTPKTYVPSGTSVRAIVLGAADASSGVTSQSDPEPMLFRILDNGTLPNHKKSNLKDCRATAAVVGDISSERGKIRLERLSCVKGSNENILDTPVEATIFGPDGKNGLRGTPLWREGALVQRAFLAGTLSGLSNGIAQSYTNSAITPWGATQVIDNHKIFQYGLANGVGNAAEKLAEYNIKRAEQFHPVIQLSAGNEVDIVFLKGFYLDGKKHDDNEPERTIASTTNSTDLMSTSYNNSTTSTNSNTATGLPLSQQQIQSLKEKNRELGYH